nr:MAG TPA: hypothetical protein [Caudoviricetes sp.]
MKRTRRECKHDDTNKLSKVPLRFLVVLLIRWIDK